MEGKGRKGVFFSIQKGGGLEKWRLFLVRYSDVGYLPTNTGFLFSIKARVASLVSCVPRK